MSLILGVRFQKLGKLYHFRLEGEEEKVLPGDCSLATT
jgi:hypothetical protein